MGLEMAGNIKKSVDQIKFLSHEISLTVNRRWWRWFTCWFTTCTWVVVSYRLSRASYLAFGKVHVAIKFILSPVLLLLRPWIGNHEIHYRADIGRGLVILHPSLGVVVPGATVAGRNLLLTGGNCIGGRKTVRPGDIVIGDNVSQGANAVILGPIRLGSNLRVGAGAVVIHDADDNQVLIGVPASPVSTRCQAPEKASLSD
jgi:serine acetyltransferase